MKTKLVPSQEMSNLVNFMMMKVDEKENKEYLDRKAKQTVVSDINLSNLLDHEPLVYKKANLLRDIEVVKTTQEVIPITIGRAFENFFLPFLLETGRFKREVETFFKVRGSLGDWTISGRADLVEYLNVSNPKMTNKDIIIRDWKSTSAFQMETVLKEFNRFEKTGVLPKHNTSGNYKHINMRLLKMDIMFMIYLYWFIVDIGHNVSLWKSITFLVLSFLSVKYQNYHLNK